MSGLIVKGGAAAMENEMKALDGNKPDFDPLMSHNWHWTSFGMRNGGVTMMTLDMERNPDNEGHYCPMCEWVRHVPAIDVKEAIDSVSDQMREHCISEGLIPRPS